MEYVRVCDAFGTGYFYIPGTETCLKIGGYVRTQIVYQDQLSAVTVRARLTGIRSDHVASCTFDCQERH